MAGRKMAETLGIPVSEMPAAEEISKKTISQRKALPDDNAFVLHTSGTSALPKRVPLTNANVCSSARSIAAALELSCEDRCLLAMPLLHGHGLVATLLPALAAGGSCVCLERFDAAKVAALLASGVTWFTGVPAMYRALLEQMGGTPAKSSLRFLRTASAAMPAALMEEIERTFGVPLIQAYGMTEAAGIASNPLPPRARKPGAAGLPVGARIAILDDEGMPIEAPGTIGDVVIQGPIVTAGYEEDDATNSVLFHDGWFRTGDRGWKCADGYLYLTGRAGEVINRGGEKISPAEIDEALAGHPAIREAAAFGAPHSLLGEDLAAAVVIRGGMNCSERELREYLLARLPAGKVPSRILFVEELPKNATGKVQRKALAKEFITAKAEEGKSTPPQNERETQVASVFAKVLGHNAPVGRQENFFSLGGDSLSAARAIANLQSLCKKRLTAGDLLRYPTVQEMAEAMDQSGDASGPVLIPVRREGYKTPFFFVYGDLLPGLNFCRDLEQALDAGSAIFVVPAPDERSQLQQRSLEGVAAKIAGAIAEAAPAGPIFLGGYCYGGMVSAEVARQLRDAGREIPLLVIIDSYPIARRAVRILRASTDGLCRLIPTAKGHERRLFRLVATVFNRINFLLKLDGAEKIEFFRLKLREKLVARRNKPPLPDAGRAPGLISQPQELPIALPLREAVKIFQWEMAGYKPRPYTGRVALFLSEEWETRRRDCREAWRALGAAVEVQTVPGNHGGCVTSHRQFLLEKLKRCFGAEAAGAMKSELAATDT